MSNKPKEKVFAERFDESKQDREKISKEAIKKHEEEKPRLKKSKRFKFSKKDDLL